MIRKAGREARILAALFWVPMALAALWVVLWPPHSVDGPAHLLGARAIADHSAPLYAGYYEIDWFPTPNLAGTRLLATLVSLGGLRFAGTTMLLLAALGTPLALRYAIRAVRPESTWLAVAGLPLAFGYLYFYGFWNYCLAIALALVCVGVAVRAAPAWPTLPTAGLTLLLTLTWLTHLVPFAAAVLFLTAVVLTGPRSRRSWVAPALSVLPGVLLSLAYLLHTDSGDGPTWTNPFGRAVGLVSLHTTITTYSRWEDVIAALVAAVLVTLGWRARRVAPRSAIGPAAGLAAVAAAVLVLVTPTNFGIDFGLIDERLAVFPVLFGLLWLAARPPEPRLAVAAATALVVASVALAAVRVPRVNDYDALADEYLSASRFIDEGTVVVALRFARYGPDAGRNTAWDPTRHLASELAAERGAVDLGHYEAVLDYFPARFNDLVCRRAVDPDLTGLGAVPPRVRLDALEDVRAGGLACRSLPPEPAGSPPSLEYVGDKAVPPATAVYVLVVGARDARGEAVAELEQARAYLSRTFERVGATGPTGLVEVWRLR